MNYRRTGEVTLISMRQFDDRSTCMYRFSPECVPYEFFRSQ